MQGTHHGCRLAQVRGVERQVGGQLVNFTGGRGQTNTVATVGDGVAVTQEVERPMVGIV